jgi:hypothetical protein
MVVDNGSVRDYFYDGGDDCGKVLGSSTDSSVFVINAVDSETRTFVKRDEAIKWIEQTCPNALPVSAGYKP